MGEVPAVRGFVLPAHVARVLPEELHLTRCVARVPQGVPQVLARPRLGLHCLSAAENEQRGQKTIDLDLDIELILILIETGTDVSDHTESNRLTR